MMAMETTMTMPAKTAPVVDADTERRAVVDCRQYMICLGETRSSLILELLPGLAYFVSQTKIGF